MKFDDLDARMRTLETAHDRCVPAGVTMVARIDGRGFTRLTKEVLDLEAPFDRRFRDAMTATATHLMSGAGFRVRYAYHQSDEISLLFDRDETTFGRKTRKFNSVLAGEASGVFSLALGVRAAFDCRISELPVEQDVVDYFRWRAEDAGRNALSAHCYWKLRSEGASAREASRRIDGMSTPEKVALLAERGVAFETLPAWQRRGSGLVWETYEGAGHNPMTNEATLVQRRRVAVMDELPEGGKYGEFVRHLLRPAGEAS